MEQLRDTAQTLQTIVNRVREVVGTDEPAPVRESYRVRVLETRVSDAEYERDHARQRAEAASRVGTEFMVRAERAEAAVERVRALHVARPNGTCAARCYSTGMAPEPWPCPTIRALDEPSPAATEATEPGRCCGKPAGAICVHDVTPPADQTTEK
jgi:hypothetical protein